MTTKKPTKKPAPPKGGNARRVATARKEQNKANEKVINSLYAAQNQGRGFDGAKGSKPAQYGNPERKLTPRQRAMNAQFGRYKDPSKMPNKGK